MKKWFIDKFNSTCWVPATTGVVLASVFVAAIWALCTAADYYDRQSYQPPQAYSYSYSYSVDGYRYAYSYSYGPEVKP